MTPVHCPTPHRYDPLHQVQGVFLLQAMMQRSLKHVHWSPRLGAALCGMLMCVITAFSSPRPITPNPPSVWYTQIGLWHIERGDTVPGWRGPLGLSSFLSHDARVDGKRSGRATAKVRLNRALVDIRHFEAHMAQGPAPASAGLLVQNKMTTYFFMIEKHTTTDSLRISRSRDGPSVSLAAVAVNVPDTSRLLLQTDADTLRFSAAGALLSIVRPPDFRDMTAVGFECVQGSVRVLQTRIEARDVVVDEPFGRATLVNLHLDRMLSAGTRGTDSSKRQHGPDDGGERMSAEVGGEVGTVGVGE